MKPMIENHPNRRLFTLAALVSLACALLVSSVGHAKAEGGKGNPNPTTTSLRCAPQEVEVGQSAHCTATISGATGAEGKVVFKSENTGSLSSISCPLSFEAGMPASCG